MNPSSSKQESSTRNKCIGVAIAGVVVGLALAWSSNKSGTSQFLYSDAYQKKNLPATARK